MSKVAALVPFKPNSRRLPNKNLLSINERPLIGYIFDRLLEIDAVRDNVYCFSSDENIMYFLPQGVNLLMRPPRLNGDAIRARELFSHAVERIDAEWIVLCHATGPLIRSETIVKGLNDCIQNGFDSACSVRKIQNYCWLGGEPVNYELDRIPQTQDLEPVFYETSGFYIFRKDDFLASGKRTFGRVSMVEVDDEESVDIDEPKDFDLARQYLKDKKDNSQNIHNYLSIFSSLKRPPIKHVAFDLDGVLIDSLHVMELAWAEVNRQLLLGIEFQSYRLHIGRPFFDILKLIGVPEEKYESVKAIYDSFSSDLEGEIKVYSGTLESIGLLSGSGVKVSIVTSKPLARARSITDLVGLGKMVDVVISPECVSEGRGKPEPDPLLAACMSVKTSPSESLYVGDMESDKECAEAANIDYAHAEWGYQSRSDKSGKGFLCLSDLVDWVLGENELR